MSKVVHQQIRIIPASPAGRRKSAECPIASNMSDQFLTIDGGIKQQFSNKWRNIVFTVLLLSLIGGAGVFYYIKGTDSGTVASRFGQVLSKDRVIDFVYGAGNDRVVKSVTPPKPLPPPLPELVGTLPEEGTFGAASIFVKDQKTGTALYAKRGYDQRPLASVTKLLTALVLLERPLHATSTATIVNDATLLDSHVYPGENYTLPELWDAMLVGSSNKAAMTLVDATGWNRDAFVERMNQKALELGMADTRVEEPTGLSQYNVSTGSDILLLLAEALKHPEIQDAMLKKEMTLTTVDGSRSRHVWNTNWLLTGWVSSTLSVVGGKTGFIDASQYNFVVRFADKDGKMIDVVVLGAAAPESRFTEARDIADAVFGAYTWP